MKTDKGGYDGAGDVSVHHGDAEGEAEQDNR
jgi:phosphoribosylaminoimidazole carboxylase (NCAIR synthetase)